MKANAPDTSFGRAVMYPPAWPPTCTWMKPSADAVPYPPPSVRALFDISSVSAGIDFFDPSTLLNGRRARIRPEVPVTSRLAVRRTTSPSRPAALMGEPPLVEG